MHIVLKLSKLCNLRCLYCYEYDELGLRERMPLEGLDGFFGSVASWYAPERREPLTFVLHGGEPLLLPEVYLREFVASLRRNLEPAGVPFRISLQTNLTRIDEKKIDLLEELGIGLGVSLDVFGDARVDARGHLSQPRALENLQKLFDLGAVERLGVGAISVLHAGNVDYAVNTFRFYRDLGLSYRILPVFSLADAPLRMRHLLLTPEQVVASYQAVARAQFESESSILVFPLYNFLTAAVNQLTGIDGNLYDPVSSEWALMVNTNGDTYNHAEAYLPEGLMGNIFRDSLSSIMHGEARRRLNALRLDRARTCEACPHGRSCSRLPVVEAVASERTYDTDGQLTCTIARPMIDFMLEQIRHHPQAMAMITNGRPTSSLAVPSL
jgi:uncharacterized protein